MTIEEQWELLMRIFHRNYGEPVKSKPKPTPEPPLTPPVTVEPPSLIVKTRLKDFILIMDRGEIPNHLIQITNASNYPFVFTGIPQYSKMYLQYFQIYKVCMELADEKFPRGDKWVLGDCGGMSWQHWQHNSYRGIADPNIRTHLHSNTHYLRKDYPLERIWVEEYYPYKTLRKIDRPLIEQVFRWELRKFLKQNLSNKEAEALAEKISEKLWTEHGREYLVDLEKMYYFLGLFKKCCPRATIQPNRALHNKFCDMGEEITYVGQDLEKHRHGLHIHMSAGSKIDGEAILV